MITIEAEKHLCLKMFIPQQRKWDFSQYEKIHL